MDVQNLMHRLPLSFLCTSGLRIVLIIHRFRCRAVWITTGFIITWQVFTSSLRRVRHMEL